MTLMKESIDHAERARFAAARGVQLLQSGRHWEADGSLAYAGTERHLAYEKWDTAEIASRALRECYAAASCPPRTEGATPHCPDCSGIVGETGIVW